MSLLVARGKRTRVAQCIAMDKNFTDLIATDLIARLSCVLPEG